MKGECEGASYDGIRDEIGGTRIRNVSAAPELDRCHTSAMDTIIYQ